VIAQTHCTLSAWGRTQRTDAVDTVRVGAAGAHDVHAIRTPTDSTHEGEAQ